MNFVTIQYLVFFSVVFFIYWKLSRRLQNLFLLAASYFFYAAWDWRFLGLIVISTLVDFVSGPRIHKATSARGRKSWLLLSLFVNIGILVYFKYFNFFAGSLIDLSQAVGWTLSKSTIHIILPVGISFYTFQTMSYSIDIYRGKLKPTHSLIDFAAFVAFFPQLVAGPIVRAKEFVFQLEKKRSFRGEDFEVGLTRFIYGFFKKAFVADTIGVTLVDPVFSNPGDFSSGILWLAMVAYSIQIYADFSGYSNMAIGSAKMLGFNMPENFAFPYLATNISEFWRKWHMTMSRFFRDYVYIGLGGNRSGFALTLRNLAATTLISGLWHGAGWTFVIWGGLHGLYITTYQIWNRKKTSHNKSSIVPNSVSVIAGWLLTYLAVCFAWVLFRSPDFASSWTFLKGLVGVAGSQTLEIPVLVMMSMAFIFVDHFTGWIVANKPNIAQRVPKYAKAVLLVGLIIFLYNARPEDANPFIYFQF